MVDIENKVFDTVSTAVKASYPNCLVSSVYLRTPADFPCVSIYEADNSVNRSSRTLESIENHANVMYEVNVFSNLSGERKSEAKAIAEIVDNAMVGLGFTRTLKSPIPNEDITIYRIVMRYSALVAKGETEGNTTTYKIYNN